MPNGTTSQTNLAIPIIVSTFSLLIFILSACTIPGQLKVFSYTDPLNDPDGARLVDQETGELITDSSSSIGATSAQQMPAVLKKLFDEVGNKVGVPPALLAAFSRRECGSLWSVPDETLENWINNNQNVDDRGCGYNNKYNCWGPAQFQAGIIYLKDKNMQYYEKKPNGAPLPPVGTWEGYINTLTTQWNRPNPNIINVQDSIYAMAVKIKKHDIDNDNYWSEFEIREAAKHYCGDCTCGGDYCGGIWELYRQFSQ